MTRQLVVGMMMTIVVLVSSCSDLPNDGVTPDPVPTAEVNVDHESDAVAGVEGHESEGVGVADAYESSGIVDDPIQDASETAEAGSPPPAVSQDSDSSGDEMATSTTSGSSGLPEAGSGLTHPKSPNTTLVVPPPRD